MSWQERWVQPRSAAPDRQFAVFTLGDLEYAVDIMRISQIIQPQPIRPVPRAPEYIDGVVELRGAVIPIMDLRRRFGLEPESVARGTKFIIVRFQGRFVGFVVDRVIGVHRVPAADIRATPEWIAGPEAAVFTGVCRREDHLVLLIDLAVLITSSDTLQVGDLQLDSQRDWAEELPAVEVVEAGGAGDDVDDWWESD